MIILRTPKGWTGPKEVDGLKTEGFWRSHQVPLAGLAGQPGAPAGSWRSGCGATGRKNCSMRPAGSCPSSAELRPLGKRRMGANPHANGGLLMRPLRLAGLPRLCRRCAGRRRSHAEATSVMGRFLRDVMRLNPRLATSASSDRTRRPRTGLVQSLRSPIAPGWRRSCRKTCISARDGRVMEILSEHLCQGWLEGYLLTGRHGFFSCYEAFVHIVDSMFNQHAKWLKVARRDAVAAADPVAQLPADLAMSGGRTTTASATRILASSTSCSTRRPTSFASICRRTPTRCSGSPTTS